MDKKKILSIFIKVSIPIVLLAVALVIILGRGRKDAFSLTDYVSVDIRGVDGNGRVDVVADKEGLSEYFVNDKTTDIEKYRQCSLYVTRANAVRLRRNEYFIADLIGMDVFLEDGSHFGTLKDVMETGANDVYVMETLTGKEVLVPAIKDCILKVEPEEGRMEIHLLPGLMDEE